MADTNSGAGGDSQEEQKGTESEATDTSKNNDGAGSHDDGGGGEGGDGAGDGDDSKKDDKKSDEQSKGADDEEPQSRKSNAWWVAKRRGDKIEKLKEKDGTDKGDDDKKGDEGKGDEDDFDSKLDRALDERLEPLKKETLEKEVDNDIASVIAEEPKFKPYADKVRKWALHPSRANIPVKSIFYEVAGADLMKLGAEKGKEADEEAKHSAGTGGGSTGADGSPKDVWSMTAEEFEAEKLRIRRGGAAQS